MKQISSVQNPFIKSLVQLQEKAKARKQSGTFLIEGLREITLATKGGYSIETILFVPEIVNLSQIQALTNQNIDYIEITKDVYQKLAYRDTTEGVLAVAKTKSLQLKDLNLSKNPLILVAEAIEKPGNIGARLRTADAANIDAVDLSAESKTVYVENGDAVSKSIKSLTKGKRYYIKACAWNLRLRFRRKMLVL